MVSIQTVETASAVEMGLRPNEGVIRGGYLKKAVLLDNVLLKFGRQFYPLWKSDNVLCAFLAGKNRSGRPLKAVRCFEDMKAAVRQFAENHIKETRAITADTPEEEDAITGSPDPVTPETVGTRHCRARRFRRCDWLTLPEVAQIDMPFAELCPGWKPWCIVDVEARSVSMEASSENFNALFNIVEYELKNPVEQDQDEPSGSGHTSPCTGEPSPAPACSPGRKKYLFQEKGWCKVMPNPTYVPSGGKLRAGTAKEQGKRIVRLQPKSHSSRRGRPAPLDDGATPPGQYVFDDDVF